MLPFICFFNYADRQVISSAFAALQKEFHFTDTQLGFIGLAFGYMYGACAILTCHFDDRVASRHLTSGFGESFVLRHACRRDNLMHSTWTWKPERINHGAIKRKRLVTTRGRR